MGKKKDLTIVVGCGKLGARVASEIYSSNANGANVIVIDHNEEAFSRLDSSFGGMTVVGDGCDFDILEKAEIATANCVIVATGFDNNNIFIGQVAKKRYDVDKVIVRILNERLKPIYEEMGIQTICPTDLSTKAVLDIYGGD